MAGESSGCQTGAPFSKMDDATFRFAPLSLRWAKDSARQSVTSILEGICQGAWLKGHRGNSFLCFSVLVFPSFLQLQIIMCYFQMTFLFGLNV